MSSLPDLLRRFFAGLFIRFGVVSAIGFLLDTGIFFLLTALRGMPVVPANVISSFLAVTYVYLFSSRKLFMQYHFNAVRYALWVGYQCVLVLTVAGAIVLIAENSPLPPVGAKLLLMPLSFTSNFLVIRRLCT